MSNKMKCACFAALCCALLCPTVAFLRKQWRCCLCYRCRAAFISAFGAGQIGAGYVSTDKSAPDESPLLSRKIQTRFSKPAFVNASELIVRGDAFSGAESYLTYLDLEPYLNAEPADLGESDPFACWLYKGPDSSKFEVGQPPITYVERGSLNDDWADFFAGKGPRPIKVSPDDVMARVPVAEPQTVSSSDIEFVDAFSSGATASGSDAFAAGPTGWFAATDSHSRSARTKQEKYFARWHYWIRRRHCIRCE